MEQIRNLSFIGYEYYDLSENGILVTKKRVIKTKHGVNKKINGKVVTPHINGNGYPAVTLAKVGAKKPVNFHRLLALCFINNPHPDIYKQINHKDGDKLNYKLNNLEWCNAAINIKHAYENGLNKRKKREESGSAKLNKEKALEIINLVNKKDISYREIGILYNVSSGCVSDIVNGKTWANKKFSIKEIELYCTKNNIKSTVELIKKLKHQYGTSI